MQSIVEERKARLAMGSHPPVTHEMAEAYYELRERRFSGRAASKALGISEPTGVKLWAAKQQKVNISDYSKAPPPKPWSDLTVDATRALEDFAYFNKRHFAEFHYAPWSGELGNLLVELYDSQVEEYVGVNIAPRAGKTTMLTRFCTWVICRERAQGREPRIMWGHRNENKARLSVAQVRRWLEAKASLIEDYGWFKPPGARGTVWTSDEFRIDPLPEVSPTERESTMTLGSYEGAILGTGFGIMIWDDLVDSSNSLSLDQRQRLIDRWEKEMENRLEPGGLLILSGARFGPDDLFHYTFSQVDPDEMVDDKPRQLYRRFSYPAHFDQLCKDNGDHTGPYPAGCLLDPTRLPWRRLRREMVKNEDRYRLIWQQEEVDPAGFLADPMWFTGGVDSKGMIVPGCFDHDRFFGQLPKDRSDAGDFPILSAITVDPAATRYWAIIHFLVYADGAQVVLNAVRRPLTSPELLYGERGGPTGWTFTGILEDFRLQGEKVGFPPRYAIVETRAAQTYLLQQPFAQQWGMRHGVVLLPHDTNRGNKADLVFGVTAQTKSVYREGRLRLPYAGYEERIFADQFQREAIAFPEGSTSDIVMAHWFLTHHLPQLVTIDIEENFVPDDIPDWVTDTTPDWALRSLTAAP
jgi:hypothetical protein